MAKVIIVTEEEFDAAFEECRQALELQKFRNKSRRRVMEPDDEMHRSFNYHVCELKIRLEKSSR